MTPLRRRARATTARRFISGRRRGSPRCTVMSWPPPSSASTPRCDRHGHGRAARAALCGPHASCGTPHAEVAPPTACVFYHLCAHSRRSLSCYTAWSSTRIGTRPQCHLRAPRSYTTACTAMSTATTLREGSQGAGGSHPPRASRGRWSPQTPSRVVRSRRVRADGVVAPACAASMTIPTSTLARAQTSSSVCRRCRRHTKRSVPRRSTRSTVCMHARGPRSWAAFVGRGRHQVDALTRTRPQAPIHHLVLASPAAVPTSLGNPNIDLQQLEPSL